MMKKLISFLLLACTLSVPGFSKNAGYMGKRFLLNAEAVVSPSWINPNFWGGKEYYAFNYILSPNIEIIAWDKGTIGLVGHYFTTRFSHVEEIPYTDYYSDFYKSTDYPLSVFGYGIFYKQYFNKAKAPFGHYVKIECDFFHYKSDPVLPEYDFLVGAKIELGKDYLFFNALHLSFGVSMGMTFSGLEATFTPNLPHDLPTSAAGRICGAYWLGFKMGIGILAF